MACTGNKLSTINNTATRKVPRKQSPRMDILTPPPMTKILLVCMGNRCRSPMAQTVTLHLVEKAGLARNVQIDSAGTHAGRGSDRPDPRAKTALSGRGYAIGKSRSRQVTEQDFERYDLILAMDQANLSDLMRICPADRTQKLHLFLEFAQAVDVCDIPDPYYGSVEGFERVLDLCEAGARGLVEHCKTVLRSPLYPFLGL